MSHHESIAEGMAMQVCHATHKMPICRDAGKMPPRIPGLAFSHESGILMFISVDGNYFQQEISSLQLTN